MLSKKRDEIIDKLSILYPNEYEEVFLQLNLLIEKWGKVEFKKTQWIDEKDCMLITYGDSIVDGKEKPLKVLNKFLTEYVDKSINNVHILPMFPFSSDDGFSVIDYRKINEDLGEWEDLENLSKSYNLMYDAVINHCSKESEYFKGFMKGENEFRDFFIESDPNLDYSKVIRPRALPLLTKFCEGDCEKYIWTSFSDDQVDLNYKNPKVLIEILDILFLYVSKGARFLRLDAIGLAWKEIGTQCMHLPQLHTLVKLIRSVLEVNSNVILITETNVPHEDNIGYFGDGYDEAGLVYQFPLPPLTLYSFAKKDTTQLTKWAKTLNETTDKTAFLNFLSSHDGIGVRPIENLLSAEEKNLIVDKCLENGGRINYRFVENGSKVPYELNIVFYDAIVDKNDSPRRKVEKMLSAESIIFSLAGMPAIYIHSLLGSKNYIQGVVESNINRRINREKLNYFELVEKLNDTSSEQSQIFNGIKTLLGIRANHTAFAPNAFQEILEINSKCFALIRQSEKEKILYVVNISDDIIEEVVPYKGKSILSGAELKGCLRLEPYHFEWFVLD